MKGVLQLDVMSFRDLQEGGTSDTSETSSTPLLDAVMFYGSIFAVGFVLYCFVRKRFPRTYAVRQWVPEIKTPAADNQFGYVDWLWKVYFFSAEDLLELIGLDALCFLRLLNMGFRLACVGAFNSIWLFPVYATAEKIPDSTEGQVIVNNISFNNLADGSPRFIATVMASYIFFVYTMYTLLKECNWFLAQRHIWLQKFKPRNYSILVRQIPKELRSDALLLQHFQRIFGPERVLEAHVLVRTTDLEDMIRKREKCVANLEHVLAQYAKSGKRPKKLQFFQTFSIHRASTNKEAEVDAMDYYTFEFNNLNEQIREKICLLQTRRGVAISRTEGTAASDVGTALHGEGVDDASGKSVCSEQVTNETSDNVSGTLQHIPPKTISSISTSTRQGSCQELVVTSSQTSKMKERVVSTGEEDHSKMSMVSLVSGRFAQGDSDILNRNATSNMSNQVQLHSSNRASIQEHTTWTLVPFDFTGSSSVEDGTFCGAGFVTFSSLLSTQGALQLNHRPEPFAMQTAQADDPTYIFWGNIDRSTEVMQIGRVLSCVITIWICFFWTFVVTFIVNWTNIDELSTTVPQVASAVESNKWIEAVLPLIAPLVLSIFNSFLPVILKAVTRLEFPASDSLLEASAFWKMATFTIIQTFFVSLISGSIVQELADLIENPTEFIKLLAISLPQQSVFFMKLLIVSTCIGTLNELFRVVPLFYSIVRAHIGRRLTEKERKQKVGMFRPLSDVDKCYYSRLHSAYLLYYIVMFVYTSISPLVNWFCLLFFCFVSSVYRHQFIFNYPQTPDSGGKIFFPFVDCLLTCMIIAELTISGFLALKRTTVAAPLMIPLLVGTIFFILYLKESRFAAGSFLAASTCVEEDAANDVRGVDYTEFVDQYKHPVLKGSPACVDWDAGKPAATSEASPPTNDEENGAGYERVVATDLKENSYELFGNASDSSHNLELRGFLLRFWSLR